MNLRCVSLIACCVLSIAAPAVAQVAAAPAAPAAAFTVRQATAQDPGHPAIPVVIWSPVAGSNLPLVVISHGTGAAPMSHADTGQALAEAGFVVAAPMHPGDNFQDESGVGKPQWFADRSRHVSRVIDFMLTAWDGHARLDPHRIGVFGFSAGGTTALIAVGGVPDLGRIAPYCAAHPEFVCRIMGPQASEAGSAPEWTHDKRIRAAVVAAPGIGFAFEPAGLAHVQAPVQLWTGAADETVPTVTNADVVRRLLPHAPEFHQVEGAVHLSFLAPCTAQSPPMLCQDKPGFDRAEFHREFNQAIVGFFRKQLHDRR